MGLEFLLLVLLGIFIGTFTGLTPGIHINLITQLILASSLILLLNPLNIIIFIISMAITHTFIDFIPSIYFGAPDEDTGLGTLPGHELLIKGEGHKAVILTLVGSTIAIISMLIIVPIFIFIMPSIYPFIQKMMGFFLIWISIFLITQNKKSKILSGIIFLLAGFLGIASFNLPIEQPLLPLLTGLFGSSTIIYSIKSETKIPKQKIDKFKFSKKDLIKPTIATNIVSPIFGLFPGLGSSQAAIIGSQIVGKLNTEQFLILLGSVNTIIMSTSFVILLILGKSRTGAANAISQLINLNQTHILIILKTIILTAIIVIPLTIYLSKLIAKRIHKIPYEKISWIILLFLTGIILKFSGIFGLIIFIVSTILGITCIEMSIRRGMLMGALLIPTIIYYLPF